MSAELERLPDELLAEVLRRLPLAALLACERVSRRWRRLAGDPLVWRDRLVLYAERGAGEPAGRAARRVLATRPLRVRRLKLQYVCNPATIVSVLKSCVNVIHLELVMCTVGAEIVEMLKSFPELRRLHVRNCMWNWSQTYQFKLDIHKKLTHLSLTHFGLDSNNFISLLNCTHLSHIFIDKIDTLLPDHIKELVVARKSIIRSFHFFGGKAADDSLLELIGECCLLTDLAIIRCENLTDKGLRCLKSLNNIQQLQLWNNNNFHEDCLLETLSNPHFFAIQRLSLSRIRNITMAVVEVLSSNYKQLTFLALYQCPKVGIEHEAVLKSKFSNFDIILR